MAFVICAIIAYLLGSVSTAVVIAKLLGKPDPRTQGSCSAGATNALRTAGKTAGIITLTGDALKGAVPVLLGSLLHLGSEALALIGLFAVIGHIFPVWFQFKGGKGVATALGALLILSFWITLLIIIIFLAIALTTRYVSLASIISAIATPLLLLIFGNPQAFFPILIMAALIIWKHKDNINRLRNGVESKLVF